MTQYQDIYCKCFGRIPNDDEMPIIETEEITLKIEEYEEKRIIKVKVCKNK